MRLVVAGLAKSNFSGYSICIVPLDHPYNFPRCFSFLIRIDDSLGFDLIKRYLLTLLSRPGKTVAFTPDLHTSVKCSLGSLAS